MQLKKDTLFRKTPHWEAGEKNPGRAADAAGGGSAHPLRAAGASQEM
jgi:hypothetical protein